jgi:D-glycero-D-manno-heptose 1,7-bisphosphate phosphatase
MKLSLFDIDGTLTKTISNAAFGESIWDYCLRDIGRAALEMVSGDLIAGITNQLGVTLGLKSLDDCIAEQHYKMSLIDGMTCIYFCPDYGDTCYKVLRDGAVAKYPLTSLSSYRKPGPGMLELAMREFGVEPSDTIYCGDLSSDRLAASAAGVNYIDLSDSGAFSKGQQWCIIDI